MSQSKPLSLRRNFSWTFIGNAIYAACQWGMIVLIAKLGSPEMVGQFTLGFAITAPVIMFTNLNLKAVQATDAKREFVFNDYFGLRIISTLLALLVIGGIAVVSGYRWETCVVILIVGLAKGVESISDIFYGLIQQHERMDRIAISLIIKGLLSLLLLTIGIYVSGNILWGVAGFMIAWAIVLVSYDIPNGVLILKDKSEIKPRWCMKTLVKLVSLCLPLGFVMMLISLNANVPRYFIDKYLGERELGIFAATAYLMVMGTMVVSALGESASPRLAKYYFLGDAIAFRNLLLKLVGIAFLLGMTGVLGSFFAGRQILTLLYRPEYAKQTNLFVCLMIAAGIGYMSSFLGYGMTAARYFRVQIPLFIIVTSVLAIGCFELIPVKGLLGAAISLIAGAIVQAIISFGVIFHALHKLKQA
jgi:O-antigen/teichoic acid export membrane protein